MFEYRRNVTGTDSAFVFVASFEFNMGIGVVFPIDFLKFVGLEWTGGYMTSWFQVVDLDVTIAAVKDYAGLVIYEFVWALGSLDLICCFNSSFFYHSEVLLASDICIHFSFSQPITTISSIFFDYIMSK